MSDYKRLSEQAVEILNKLHTERLDYQSEYLPLIDCAQALGELADKLEAGTLVELPCKVGDIVYCLMAQGTHGTVYTTGAAISRAVTKIIWDGRRFEIYSERSHIWSTDYNECNYYGYWGETVFLTREAAEARLKELEEKCERK